MLLGKGDYTSMQKNVPLSTKIVSARKNTQSPFKEAQPFPVSSHYITSSITHGETHLCPDLLLNTSPL